MQNVLSFLYIMVFAFSGFLVSRLLFPRDRLMKQIAFGLTAGLVMLLWLPVLLAFIFDFTPAVQIAALVIAAAIGVLCLVLGRKRAKTGRLDLKKDRGLILTAVPLILVGAVLMNNHYIVNASNGSLHVGQCTYGDLCMHLSFITSISAQQTFPPMYSILPDTQLCYPFLCDSVSSTFYSIGASLRWATTLPALYAYVVVVLGVYLFFEDWFRRSSIAVLATWLFFIGGGFGFWYFFDNAKTYEGLTSSAAWEDWIYKTHNIRVSVNDAAASPLDMSKVLLGGWYKTPTNFVDNGLRWVNSIADMLLPQRATLFGWALLFPALQLLRRAVFDRENRLFIYLGVLAGAMPLVHTHSFFALGIISVFLFIAMLLINVFKKGSADEKKARWKNFKYFFFFGLIAAALAAPQLFGFTFRQSSSGGFIKYHFNWCNESDSWLWFYIKNMGLIFLLMFPAFISTKKEHKLFYGGTLLIWLICEFIVFQPNTYDNNKLLFVWFAFTCGIVAELIIKLWDRLTKKELPENAKAGEAPQKRPLSTRIACGLAFTVLIGSMMLSGVMTLHREYVSGDHFGKMPNGEFGYTENGYEVVSAELCEAAEWVKANTEPDATFLTATNHNNAIAMLTGRNIICGSESFVYYHGLDYRDRFNSVRKMYEAPAENFYKYAELYGVDYVLISSWETGDYSIDFPFFRALEPVFKSGQTTIYKVR